MSINLDDVATLYIIGVDCCCIIPEISKREAVNVHLFFINNPFLTLAPKIVYAFLKSRPKKLFSNYLVDGLLISISI